MAVGLERAHAQRLGQGQGLLVVDFGLCDIGGIGVGMKDAKLVQRVRFVLACLLLSGHVERLVRVLPGLFAASRQTTDLAEQCELAGMELQGACSDSFVAPFLQQQAPLREAALAQVEGQ